MFRSLPGLSKICLTRSHLLQQQRYFSDALVTHVHTFKNSDSTPFDFTPENYEHVHRILSKYPSNYKKSAVIPLLHLAQEQEDNFLSLAAMKKVADIIETSDMEVYEVATFYTMFNRSKVGKFHLQICGTTPCQLCGAEEIIAAAEKHLGIHNGETTKDGMFTIQEVLFLKPKIKKHRLNALVLVQMLQ